MLNVHREANRLVDLASNEDREGYKRELERIRAQYDPVTYSDITNLAKRQVRMWDRSSRLFGWRVEWTRAKKQDRRQHGAAEPEDHRGATDTAAGGGHG